MLACTCARPGEGERSRNLVGRLESASLRAAAKVPCVSSTGCPCTTVPAHAASTSPHRCRPRRRLTTPHPALAARPLSRSAPLSPPPPPLLLSPLRPRGGLCAAQLQSVNVGKEPRQGEVSGRVRGDEGRKFGARRTAVEPPPVGIIGSRGTEGQATLCGKVAARGAHGRCIWSMRR